MPFGDITSSSVSCSTGWLYLRALLGLRDTYLSSSSATSYAACLGIFRASAAPMTVSSILRKFVLIIFLIIILRIYVRVKCFCSKLEQMFVDGINLVIFKM